MTLEERLAQKDKERLELEKKIPVEEKEIICTEEVCEACGS
jgi:hypothetical protein